MNEQVCCTCASILSIPESEQSEKPRVQWRSLNCCGRIICNRCIEKRPQFARYCPFCQLSDEPSALPQGLRDPPPYSERNSTSRTTLLKKQANEENHAAPPSYSPRNPADGSDEASQRDSKQGAGDTIHYLHPSDTIMSLALAYNVPQQALRTHNSVYSDHLLAARKTVSIPASLYSGPSLSPRPVESDEESARKTALRRFMTLTKCHEYNVAEIYLQNVDGDLDRAVEAWLADEKWERENPLQAIKKGKSKRETQSDRNNIQGGLVGQLR